MSTLKNKPNCAKKGQVTMEFLVSIMLVLAIFVFGLFIAGERNDLNFSSSQRWIAKETAYQIARDIDNAYLLDDNSSISDVIYWSSLGKSISLGTHSVQVTYNTVSAEASVSTSDIDWRVTELNGTVYFKKLGGRVVVSYS